MLATGEFSSQERRLVDIVADSSKEKRPKLGFFRGADFSTSVGVTDWRVGLFLPEFGFETWIFGTGDEIPVAKTDLRLVPVKVFRVPFLATAQMVVLYTIQAVRLGLDVIICNWGLAAAGMLCKLLRPSTKVILDVRTMPIESHGLTSYIYNLYFDFALKSKSFDAISIITNGMLDAFEEHYHFKGRIPTAVWGSGFDHDLFLPALDGSKVRESLGLGNQFVVMFHGSLSPSRGLDQVIRCVRILLDGGMDDLRFVVIGRGSALPDLVRLATELGVEDHVMFLPPVPHHKIPELVAATDLGINPWPDHPWWRDQSPLKVYEYLAMGKPVIATNIPCHHSISEAVILAPNNAPSALADAILEFRSLPPQEKSRLKNAALQDAQQHTWRARAQVLADFVRNQVLDR